MRMLFCVSVILGLAMIVIPGYFYQDAFDTCMKNHSEFTCRNSLR